MRKIIAGLMATALLIFPAFAEDFEVADPDSGSKGDTQVIGAQPALASDWPATRIFRSSLGGCTSTVVGEYVILTAAHCVNDGAKANLKKISATLTCEHHPDYNPDTSEGRFYDYALCFSDKKISGIDYETINTSIAYPVKGHQIRLLGYGCLREGGYDESFGTLYHGLADVAATSSNGVPNITTVDTVAVCYGDSGGAAYVELNNGRRLIVGVNARGDIKTVSYIAPTNSDAFVDWAKDWAKDWSGDKVKVCGLHPNAVGCR